jgi:hypothetical protein
MYTIVPIKGKTKTNVLYSNSTVIKEVVSWKICFQYCAFILCRE